MCAMFAGAASATTVNIDWIVEDNIYTQTTCTVGGDIVLPQTPSKYGYDFLGWKPTYVPIEYLESTGTQYVDTGYIPTNTTRLDIKYMVTQTPSKLTSGGCPIGARVTYLDRMFGIYSPVNYENYNVIVAGNNPAEFDNFSPLNKEIIATIDIPNHYRAFDVEGTVYSSNLGIVKATYVYPLYMFVMNNAGTPGFSNDHIRIYYVQIKEGNNIVHDFIPVFDTEGTPAMFDKVTEQYFYNSGTGDFITGPRI